MQSQARANLELVGKQSQILRSLDEQLQSLEAIRKNPRLRGAVGSLEIEAKRNQKINAQSEYERSLLGATQATESTQDLVVQAQSAVRAAKEAFEDLIANPSYRPLEKQIELLRIQLDQATLLAPGPGSVLQVAVIAGERTATVPLIEMADLSQMSCVAEVHESDVGLVRIGQVAEMKSASLSRSIRGKVSRIDRLVGVPQIRSPNPLARSDFRSVAVWIQIDADDVPIASQRVQLQVEVAISP
jgi:HlyD family secretion protein